MGLTPERRWLLLLLVLGLIALVLYFPHFIPWLLGLYPTPPGTPVTYQLWSGFMPAVAIVSVIWPFVSCTVGGCMRYGRYRIKGLRVCHVHHPDDEVTRGGVSHEYIKRLHRE